jgi:hypothetical protein
MIVWGYSTYSRKAFCVKKKIIKIMTGIKRRSNCRELRKKCNNLPPVSRFMLSLLLLFVTDNMEKFETDSDIHNVSTRYKHNLHLPNAV